MKTRLRTFTQINDEGMVRCHRHGYAHITSQACAEKSSSQAELCGGCGARGEAISRLSENIPGGLVRIVELAKEKKLSAMADPYVAPVDKPFEGRPGEQRVNTSIVYINGVRALLSKVVVLVGKFDATTCKVEFPRSLMNGRPLNNVCVDRYVEGRLQGRFEWGRGETYNDPADDGKYELKLSAVGV